MAKIIYQNPKSSEAQSPLIAGLSEAVSKISDLLNMQVGSFTDMQLENVAISEEDKNRIYEAPDGRKLWLNTADLAFKKNGNVITQTTNKFSVDYVGGSITFEDTARLADGDIVTVTGSYIMASSTTLNTILAQLTAVTNLAKRYLGEYNNIEALELEYPTGVEGDFALVVSPNFGFYAWDKATSSWKNTQSIEDLANYYNKTETDTLVNEAKSLANNANTNANAREPKITAGTTAQYFRGDKTFRDFATDVRATTLTGLSTADTNNILATDTNLVALGKAQAQLTKVKADYVPNTRKVNNKALSADITLSYSDVQASKKSTIQTATLNSASWVDSTYTLNLTGVTAISVQEILPTVDITAEELTALQTANIIDNGQSTDTIVLKALGTVPTIDIPIRVILRGDIYA